MLCVIRMYIGEFDRMGEGGGAGCILVKVLKLIF